MLLRKSYTRNTMETQPALRLFIEATTRNNTTQWIYNIWQNKVKDDTPIIHFTDWQSMRVRGWVFDHWTVTVQLTNKVVSCTITEPKARKTSNRPMRSFNREQKHQWRLLSWQCVKQAQIEWALSMPPQPTGCHALSLRSLTKVHWSNQGNHWFLTNHSEFTMPNKINKPHKYYKHKHNTHNTPTIEHIMLCRLFDIGWTPDNAHGRTQCRYICGSETSGELNKPNW